MIHRPFRVFYLISNSSVIRFHNLGMTALLTMLTRCCIYKVRRKSRLQQLLSAAEMMKFSLAFVAILALTGAVCAGPVAKSSSELHDVFQEFLELVPVEPIKSIVKDYLENDREVQQVITYIGSEDFKNLVKKVESIEDVLHFYNYLQESGLDVYSAVNYFHQLIDLPPLVPGQSAHLRAARGGIAGLVADIKAILPLEDIKALYHKKLETSPAFAHLVDRLHSRRFQELINALRANEEFRKIVGFAYAAGLDVGAITDLLKTLFGLEFPDVSVLNSSQTEALERDFLDFLAILPFDKLQAIQENYYNNDPEFQKAGKYIQTDEFAEKLQQLESIKEVKVFLNFLQETGINVHGLLDQLHEALEIPSFKPTSLSRKTGGVLGFVAEVKAVLPSDKLRALNQEKLRTSAAFLHLYKRVTSPEFHHKLAAVREHAQASAIIAVFKSHGINFVASADLSASIFGFQ